MRGHEHRAHRVAAAGMLDRLDVDPVLVEADGNDIGAERPERGHGRFVGQFPDDHRIALAEQALRDEEAAVLAAAGDAHILRRDWPAALAFPPRRARFAPRGRTAPVAMLATVYSR